jgi:hypothetical protein
MFLSASRENSSAAALPYPSSSEHPAHLAQKIRTAQRVDVAALVDLVTPAPPLGNMMKRGKTTGGVF